MNPKDKSGRVDKKQSRKFGWIELLLGSGLLTALITAMPHFVDTYKAWRDDIPTASVAIANESEKLWEKNFSYVKNNPVVDYKTEHNISLGGIICPNGDVLLKIKYADNKEQYRWIGKNTFGGKAKATSSLFVPGEAVAAESLHAQVGGRVICQRWLKPGVLLLRRIMYPNNQCFDQTVDVRTGYVINQKPAPCDPNC